MSVVFPSFLLVANFFTFLTYFYSSSFAKSNPNECNLAVTSSNDFLPKFLTFIISVSDLLVKSSTVEDLANKTQSDMMKVRNLGKKSLDEVVAKLHALGLEFANEEE